MPTTSGRAVVDGSRGRRQADNWWRRASALGSKEACLFRLRLNVQPRRAGSAQVFSRADMAVGDGVSARPQVDASEG